MSYRYLAFGIPVISEIELPALLPYEEAVNFENPIRVKLGRVPPELSGNGSYADQNTYCNATEMLYTVADKIKFYISGGIHITIEPISENYAANLIYFYSNCLAAILYQRNLIPFHVSGVFVAHNKVVLFAAPSGTGKSTLALKLQELGYRPFTDDTAILYMENGKCYAQASYPMIRLWQNTLNSQTLLKEEDKQVLYEEDEFDKYGFSFHHQFSALPVEVTQIIFLEADGTEMQVKPITPMDAFITLTNNVYRCHWIAAMGKNRLQFTLISEILATISATRVCRPADTDSFEQFPLIIKKVLQNAF